MPNLHIIRSGERLSDIAAYYGMTLDQLLELNGHFDKTLSKDGQLSNAASEEQKWKTGTPGRDGDNVFVGETIWVESKYDLNTFDDTQSITRKPLVGRTDDPALEEHPTLKILRTQADRTGVENGIVTDHPDGFVSAGEATDFLREGTKYLKARNLNDGIPGFSPREAEEVIEHGEQNWAQKTWADSYKWLGENRVLSFTNGLNRVTFYGAWAAPGGVTHPIMQQVAKTATIPGFYNGARTGAIAYGMAQFFQGFRPEADKGFAVAKTAEVGVAAGLFFNGAVNALKGDPEMATLFEKWLGGSLKGESLIKFTQRVNEAIAKDPDAINQLTLMQKMMYGTQKPGQTFAHDVIIKGFSVALAADIGNLAYKHGDLFLRSADDNPNNDPTATEWCNAGKDAAVGFGKHAPLLCSTYMARSGLQAANGEVAAMTSQAESFRAQANALEDTAENAAAKKALLESADALTENTKSVLASAKLRGMKWMQGGFAAMDGALILKSEFDLYQKKEELETLTKQHLTEFPGTPDYNNTEYAIKAIKYEIHAVEQARLSSAAGMALNFTPVALYKDVADLLMIVGMPTEKEYADAKMELGLDPQSTQDPFAGLFRTASPTIFIRQKLYEHQMDAVKFGIDSILDSGEENQDPSPTTPAAFSPNQPINTHAQQVRMNAAYTNALLFAVQKRAEYVTIPLGKAMREHPNLLMSPYGFGH